MLAPDRITATEIPDGAIVSQELAIVGYLDTDGKFAYIIQARGQSPVSSYLGLLVFAEHELVKWAARKEDDDGADD